MEYYVITQNIILDGFSGTNHILKVTFSKTLLLSFPSS